MDKCFFVNLTTAHSKQNKILCDSLNASMVSVHSPQENEFLRRLVFIHYDSHKWVWLSRARNYNKTHGYLWSDSTVFDYTNWVGPEVDCSVCCEISLMTSGHWFASNCNSWTFAQVCQKDLPASDYDADSSLRSLDGNFYLSQFGTKGKSAGSENSDPKMSELIEWLSYEVEGFRQDIVKLENQTQVTSSLEDILRERDSYLLTLLGIVVSLLMCIMFAILAAYVIIYKRISFRNSFMDST
jgi:hypothetical protein